MYPTAESATHRMAGQELVYEPDFPDRETIQAAFEQLFGEEEKGKVRRFSRSGLRYITLSGGTTLIDQNPSRKSRWAQITLPHCEPCALCRDGMFGRDTC